MPSQIFQFQTVDDAISEKKFIVSLIFKILGYVQKKRQRTFNASSKICLCRNLSGIVKLLEKKKLASRKNRCNLRCVVCLLLLHEP